MVAGNLKKRPSLDLIQIASPCTASWDDMPGDERVRHCGDCKLNVYNLSEMTRDEAETFMAEREGRVCIAFYRRHDGTVITRDCPVGIAAVRAKFVRLALATAGLFLAFAATALSALGKMPGVGPYVSQGRIEQLRNMHAPPSFALGGCPAPPMRITPTGNISGSPTPPSDGLGIPLAE
jgi:hypothetical protein